MGFHRSLVQLTWVGVISSVMVAATDTQFPTALPNCPDRCGDLQIPYPFGLTEGCYLSGTTGTTEFLIDCDKSLGKPQPKTGDFLVTNISVEEGQIEIMMDIDIDCYNKNGTPQTKLMRKRSLTNPIFTISHTKNELVSVGCDTYAYLRGFRNDRRFTSFCLSVCESKSDVVNESCSGIGCCQADIPGGLRNVTVETDSLNNHIDVWDFNPCGYAFVIREDKFNFSSAYLTTLNNKTLPVVLDWTIGSEKCDLGRNKSNEICGENSICVNLTYGAGYRCECKDGYRGNPYLDHGCQDIDECQVKDNNTCPSKQKCVNKPGGYDCLCIEGYHLEEPERVCVPDRSAGQSSLAIYLAVGLFSLLVLLMGYSWIYWGLKRRKLIKLKGKFFQQNGGLLLKQQLSNHQMSVETTKIFTIEELKKATNNYDESRVLGQGGYGTVYKGVLSDNTIVAIKKSKIELLTGKKALSFDRPEIERNLAISFVSAIKEDRLLQILEDHIVNEVNIEQLKEVANLAKRCLSLRGEDRPSMKETEHLLSATSDSFNVDVDIGCSTSTTVEYDSIGDQELKSVKHGR
ncbi:hypothetical protein CMV_007674 [Castanea mollissima]|uniref:EGF-like domain-containing protein n=1 Tax=Castanea mollissima TaxID=60419 RepID=A0A8J4R8M6_9ROSI|nr:hypothetical protein CMV_007674 [Castanea mollissima]